MRLKHIKLAGFKSFVDPTTITLPGNLTAIVGPNGCGKSNVIDAVRWVMGESSAKNLRSEGMAEVIFNGASGRKPVGQASVELVFDNSEGRLQGEYGAYQQIAVRREVGRDGHSQYFLNGTSCRRKDIVGIFLGTGLGSRSYAIIEQGMISQLIDSKPQELRLILEEAAGISKYKERRRETELRMQHTQENLARLADIQQELDERLKQLQKQAEAAEKYRTYKQQERELRAQLLALQWRTLHEQSQQLQQRIIELERDHAREQAEYQRLETAIEQGRMEHEAVQTSFNQTQANYYTVAAEIADLEQKLKHASERAEQLLRDADATAQSKQQTDAHLHDDEQKLARLQQEQATLGPELMESKRACHQAMQVLVQADQAMQDWQTQWNTWQEQINVCQREADVARTRIQHSEQTLQRLQQQEQKLADEAAALQTLPIQTTQIAEKQARKQALTQKRDHTAQQLQQCIAALHEHRTSHQQQQQHIHDLREAMHKDNTQLATLQALQKVSLEDREGIQKNLAESYPRLAQHIQVEAGWEKALEVVMGEWLRAFWAPEWSELLTQCQQSSTSWCAWVGDTTSLDTNAPGFLLSKLRTRAPIMARLAGVRIAEDLEDALAQQSRLGAAESVVTRDGIWLGPGWVRVGGQHDPKQGIIVREREIKKLEQSVQTYHAELLNAQQILLEQEEAIQQADHNRALLQQESMQCERALAEINTELATSEEREQARASRSHKVAEELNEIRGLQSEHQQQLHAIRQTLAGTIENMADYHAKQEQTTPQKEQLQRQLEEARTHNREQHDKERTLALRFESIKVDLEHTTASLQRLQQQHQQLELRLRELHIQHAQTTEPLTDWQKALTESLSRHHVIEEALSVAREQLNASQQTRHHLEQARGKQSQLTQQLQQTLMEQRVQQEGLDGRAQALTEQLAALDAPLDQILPTLIPEAVEAEWQQRLSKVLDRIERLGAINLAALEEFSTQQERSQYLAAQRQDLDQALATLESAIRKIDQETKTRFKETYDKVNQGLQTLFPKVFAGGEASLTLVGDDLLDTGIAIMARPPGKRNSTIHQLSGGEKALTAISLVFAIFELNPAPFCLLDEVDAPLDDANVGRFCRLVREMSSRVQFIYISHNKATIQMADHLLGVTMQEPGVSRLVSVSLEEAEQELVEA